MSLCCLKSVFIKFKNHVESNYFYVHSFYYKKTTKWWFLESQLHVVRRSSLSFKLSNHLCCNIFRITNRCVTTRPIVCATLTTAATITCSIVWTRAIPRITFYRLLNNFLFNCCGIFNTLLRFRPKR